MHPPDAIERRRERKNASVGEMNVRQVQEFRKFKSQNFGKNLTLNKSAWRRRYSAAEIKRIRSDFEVLDVEQGGRKKIIDSDRKK